MSLVISAWDEHAGVAVCEGRALAWVDGKYVPVDEDYSKLTRLPNGGIFGITGRPREGHSIANALDGVVAEHLRPAIIQAAQGRGFCELCAFIPNLLKEYAALWPGLIFFVSLLGTDNGVVRGGAWDSDGGASVPTGAGVTWHILSPRKMGAETDDAVRVCLSHIGGLHNPALAGEVLQDIIRLLAMRHSEINDHTRVEYLRAHEEAMLNTFAALTADMITTGTLNAADVNITNINASNITTGTIDAAKVVFPDGSALTTAGVITQTAQTSMAAAISTSGFAAISGLLFNVTTGSTNDVYNILAMLSLLATSAAQAQIELVVDGNSVKQSFTFSLTGSGAASYVPFMASITGLSAGTHTLQFYGYANGSVNIEALSYAMCQRIF